MKARLAWSAWIITLGVTVLQTQADDRKPKEPTVPKGTRAFAVKPKQPAEVLGFILPNMKVDVVGTTENADGKPDSRVVLADILVVAVEVRERPNNNKKEWDFTVVLAVTPAQAEKLALAQAKATISLVLRKPDDKGAKLKVGGKEQE